MNIYQLQQDLISIFDEIEENGGELTPELEKELSIKQDEFKEKVENYTKVIKFLEQDLNAIKEEKKRLTDLAASKQRIIDRLTRIIIEAINTFGETKKTGVKYLDYGTGSVSIRNSTAVDVDEVLLDNMGKSIKHILSFAKETNQLDVVDKIDTPTILASMYGTVTESDIDNVNLKIGLTIPVYALIDGSGYNAIKEIVKYTNDLNVEPTVSKADLKNKLKENGSCIPNLARLVNNQSIQIK